MNSERNSRIVEGCPAGLVGCSQANSSGGAAGLVSCSIGGAAGLVSCSSGGAAEVVSASLDHSTVTTTGDNLGVKQQKQKKRDLFT